MEKRKHFHRAIELNISIGSVVMRRLIGKYLKDKGVSLKDHLNERQVRNTLTRYQHLCSEHFHATESENPTIQQMDLSLLTIIILNTFPNQLTQNVKQLVKQLRQKRNKLSHVVNTELDDDTLFLESSQTINSIAKIGGDNAFTLEINTAINELRKRELVNNCGNLERVKINNEMFVVKLVESDGTGNGNDDGNLMIKVGMTKWTRQIARGIDVGLFLRDLKDEGVISQKIIRAIENEYSADEQIQALVLHMINETRFNICMWCQCLRQMSPQLADLVENKNTDGREIDEYIKNYEKENTVRILKEELEEDIDSSIPTADVHIKVEERLVLHIDFSTLRHYVLEVFPRVRHLDNDSSFSGLRFKISRQSGNSSLLDETREPLDVSQMSCEDFAKHVAETLSKVKPTLYEPFLTAFIDQSISPKAFREMTKEEMKEVFTPYLGGTVFGIGLQKELMLLQKEIRYGNQTITPDDLETLRPFDTPTGTIRYRKRYVKSVVGNIITPKQEFRWTSSSYSYTRFYLAKETIKFLCACINGRRNGTIYFGIKSLQNGTGQIIGIPMSGKMNSSLNEEITHSIQVCFKENSSIALRCIRPIQIVPVDDDGYIVEIDVVPFSMYINKNLLQINFPPKGCQKPHCFIYDLKLDCEICPVSKGQMNNVQEAYVSVFEQRKRLENENNTGKGTRKRLVRMLTGGNRYFTDEYVPIMVCGKITGSLNEDLIRHQLDMDRAFASCKLILDFDNSVELRKKFEGGQRLYTIKTADDKMDDADTWINNASPTWLYCNGNLEIDDACTQGQAMSMENWLENRYDGVKRSMDCMGKIIPKTRAKVIFLLFHSDMHVNERRPLYEVARTAFMSTFRNQCVVIAERDEDVKDLKEELVSATGGTNFDNFFLTGLSWSVISQVLNSVSRMNPDVVCKLPHCDGHFVEMTKKEKEDGKFTDIDILSGEECNIEEAKMSGQERRKNNNDTQQNFYRGGPVSSWNFYYGTHVGKRDLFDRHKSEILEKLTGKGEDLIEIQEIEHHPGAGGSTLGKHLLWYLSQFMTTPEKAYRCCSIRSSSVSEETINQIEILRSFKEGDSPKPFIVLADNKSEDSIILLRTKLHELAYKTGCPGKLFCLIIIINRVPIMHDNGGENPVLKHTLSSTEQNWFESKYKEMENSNDIDVKTLIAFNFMRKSFDPDYMRTTVESIMHGVSKKERNVLRCLSLISSYESDHPVPENVFDKLMTDEINFKILSGQPWGIAHSCKELQQMTRTMQDTWNIQMSDAMALLITKKEDADFYNSGVCLISQLLARCVLDYIKNYESLTLEMIVGDVLDLVMDQQRETNPMSKRFIKIVCSLFKTRQLLESERGDIKEKFSDLVLDLELCRNDETEDEANGRVLRAMQRCFDITEDAMVGQQLARFNIHIKQFEAAKDAIKQSLEKKPKSSYLFDTFGQIYKSKMEHMVDKALYDHGSISNTDAKEIIEYAFKAIEKFKEGQQLAVSVENDTNWGCSHTEVKTGLYLLEKFEKFNCFENRKHLVSFLNDDKFQINSSPSLCELMAQCPVLENLRTGREVQCHLETSLRCLEERNYQVKRELYTIHSENETLLLKLRERFERFYGSQDSTSKYQFKYGIGLKPLMVAKEKHKHLLLRRVKEAEENLKKIRDERDLLVYLGNKIISLSGQANEREECTQSEYRTLLSYSNELVSIQTTAPRSKRLYLETFLYHAMLHWPLRSRTELDCDVLTRPAAYKHLLQKWEESYNNNFFIKSNEQNKKNKPKNYFALGKGTPGNDIVDLESIRKEWKNRQKKNTGRVRKPVFADKFWRESFVEERLGRLEGTIDGSGHVVIHKVFYRLGTDTFRIKTYYPCCALSNRVVTFVLGFTWKGPTAFDVREKGTAVSHSLGGCDVFDNQSSLSSEDGNLPVESSGNKIDGPEARREASQPPDIPVHPEAASDTTGTGYATNDLPPANLYTEHKSEPSTTSKQNSGCSRRKKKNQRKKKH